MEEEIVLTKSKIVEIFNKWKKEYDENPNNYLEYDDDDRYAEICADYFIKLFRKIG